MSVWFAIPSKREHQEAQALFDKWKALGFKTAAFRDQGDSKLDVDLIHFGQYKGYPAAVNVLCKLIQCFDSSANIIVVAGDDYLPDPKISVDKIEQEFIGHFKGTFGVMQPTGDRWMLDSNNTCASERVCDAPWIGREFCERMYGGRGPLCEQYYHFFEDEELHEVANKLKVLWHRADIYQYHNHWSRNRNGRTRPSFLSEAKLDWNTAKDLFNFRKSQDFPGHEPLSTV